MSDTADYRVYGVKQDAELAALRQRVAVLEEALRYFRERMLHYMEAEGFNQDTDSSPILDRIDDALATMDTPTETEQPEGE